MSRVQATARLTTRPRPHLYLAAPTLDPASGLWELPSHALIGRNRQYFWQGPGPLSLKMFTGGTARYGVGRQGLCAVDDSAYLVLNREQTYSITIDEPEPVTSCCLFFAAGVAEAVQRSLTACETALLDDPAAMAAPVDFFERTYPHDAILSPHLFTLRTALMRLGRDEPDPAWLSEQMNGVMAALLRRHGLARQEADRLQEAAIARPATREELYRRLYLARDYIAASFDMPLTLEEMATVACLSPNHFLRTFKALFHTTPYQFLTERRLYEACRLLARGDLSVTAVCLRVGFASLGSFSHLFSRRVGVSPEAYRRKTAGGKLGDFEEAAVLSTR